MAIQLVSDEQIAETSSKGNQEKWYDSASGCWYKLDQLGYEALAESAISSLLEKSGIETDTPFIFVRYSMEKMIVHGKERTGCSSNNFLRQHQSIITVNRLLSNCLGYPLKKKLKQLPSIIKRIEYLAETTAEYTGLSGFGRYLTLLFEIDALFCNDDRHLNNIAVIKEGDRYTYCPIFDNAAGLLSDTQTSRMDIVPKALLAVLRARPFNTTFNRQMLSARKLYGRQLTMPKLDTGGIYAELKPLLKYYPERDRGIIAQRATDCIMLQQKAFR